MTSPELLEQHDKEALATDFMLELARVMRDAHKKGAMNIERFFDMGQVDIQVQKGTERQAEALMASLAPTLQLEQALQRGDETLLRQLVPQVIQQARHFVRTAFRKALFHSPYYAVAFHPVLVELGQLPLAAMERIQMPFAGSTPELKLLLPFLLEQGFQGVVTCSDVESSAVKRKRDLCMGDLPGAVGKGKIKNSLTYHGIDVRFKPFDLMARELQEADLVLGLHPQIRTAGWEVIIRNTVARQRRHLVFVCYNEREVQTLKSLMAGRSRPVVEVNTAAPYPSNYLGDSPIGNALGPRAVVEPSKWYEFGFVIRYDLTKQ